MFVLLLMLGAALCTGYESENHSENYGKTLKIRLPWRSHLLIFFHDDSLEGTVLWNSSDPANSAVRTGSKSGCYYVIDKVTQQNRGIYEIRDKSNNLLSKTNIDIKVKEETVEVRSEILHEEVTKSCDGHFEVSDDYGNQTLNLALYVNSFDATPIVISAVVLFATILCCCYVRSCCCKKSSTNDQQPDNEPDFGEPSEMPYSAQPNSSTAPLIHKPSTVNVPSAYSQVSAPAEPRYAPTVPVSYPPTVPVSYPPTVPVSYPPTVPVSYPPTVPVSYPPTVPVSYPPTVPVSYPPTVPVSYPPTVPVSCAASEFDPRFELKNFSSCSPLSSDSTEVSVYNSDKLNFL